MWGQDVSRYRGLLAGGSAPAVVAAVLALAGAVPVGAEAPVPLRVPSLNDAEVVEPDPRFEVSTGGDRTAGSDFAHAAVVWAFGRSLYEPGWRVRVMGGAGRYAYDGTLPVDEAWVPVRFSGEALAIEALLGRQWQHGGLFVKAYAGPQFARHGVRPDDPGNTVRGEAAGAKALLEVWYTQGRAWLSSDASYATAFGDYWGQLRLGYRAAARASLGVEAAVLGNRGYRAARAGGFLRLHLPRMDVTLVGGWVADRIDTSSRPYVSVTVDRRF